MDFGRIIIDSKIFFENVPYSKPRFRGAGRIVSDMDDDYMYPDEYMPSSNEEESLKFETGKMDLSDEHYRLCLPYVRGFSVATREWGKSYDPIRL